VPRRVSLPSEMKIFLKSIGDLRDYFGRGPQEVELADGSSFEDLLEHIGVRWGPNLPRYLWDAQKKRFRGAVYFLMHGQVVQDFGSPLEDGGEVVLMRALSGG
jgi:hypothetical protein